jgi:hypothetical protein
VLLKTPIDLKFVVIRDTQAQTPHMNSGGEIPTDTVECDVRLLEQFYKREENAILFQVYEVLCRNSERDLVYSEIC